MIVQLLFILILGLLSSRPIVADWFDGLPEEDLKCVQSYPNSFTTQFESLLEGFRIIDYKMKIHRFVTPDELDRKLIQPLTDISIDIIHTLTPIPTCPFSDEPIVNKLPDYHEFIKQMLEHDNKTYSWLREIYFVSRGNIHTWLRNDLTTQLDATTIDGYLQNFVDYQKLLRKFKAIFLVWLLNGFGRSPELLLKDYFCDIYTNSQTYPIVMVQRYKYVVQEFDEFISRFPLDDDVETDMFIVLNRKWYLYQYYWRNMIHDVRVLSNKVWISDSERKFYMTLSQSTTPWIDLMVNTFDKLITLNQTTEEHVRTIPPTEIEFWLTGNASILYKVCHVLFIWTPSYTQIRDFFRDYKHSTPPPYTILFIVYAVISWLSVSWMYTKHSQRVFWYVLLILVFFIGTYNFET